MRGTQLPLSTLPNRTWEKGNDVVLPGTDSGLSLLFAYADSARSLRTPPGLISPGRRTADFLSCRTYYSNLLERNFSSAGLACTLSGGVVLGGDFGRLWQRETRPARVR